MNISIIIFLLWKKSPYVSFFETFASFTFRCFTKPLSKKMGENFVKDWNECVIISRQMIKKIYKNLSFSQNPLHILCW